MSRIYFDSPDSSAVLRGSERAYMGVYIAELFYASLRIPSYPKPDHPFFDLIPQDCYLREHKRDWAQFERMLKTWIRVGDGHFEIEGEKVGLFELGLNTALAIGNDSIKLMARIHGQCELHSFVEGRNRSWLAKMIEDGLKSQIYRKGQGWEEVATFLGIGTSEVVLSFSVCDHFPSKAGKWEAEMQELRKSKYLELNPESWSVFSFGNPDKQWNAFSVNRHIERSVA